MTVTASTTLTLTGRQCMMFKEPDVELLLPLPLSGLPPFWRTTVVAEEIIKDFSVSTKIFTIITACSSESPEDLSYYCKSPWALTVHKSQGMTITRKRRNKRISARIKCPHHAIMVPVVPYGLPPKNCEARTQIQRESNGLSSREIKSRGLPGQGEVRGQSLTQPAHGAGREWFVGPR